MYHVATLSESARREDDRVAPYECMSAVIALAFSVEAMLNFVGKKKLGDEWNERARYRQKVQALEKRLNFKYAKADEPYLTLETLKEARDHMAHGKPVELEIVANTKQDVVVAMRPAWTPATDPTTVLAAARRVSEFKEFLFKRARIKPGSEFSSYMAMPE